MAENKTKYLQFSIVVLVLLLIFITFLFCVFCLENNKLVNKINGNQNKVFLYNNFEGKKLISTYYYFPESIEDLKDSRYYIEIIEIPTTEGEKILGYQSIRTKYLVDLKIDQATAVSATINGLPDRSMELKFHSKKMSESRDFIFYSISSILHAKQINQ